VAASDEAPDTLAAELGIYAGSSVRELGWDSAVDDDLRRRIEEIIRADLTDEDATLYQPVHAVLFWWRKGDGSLRHELTKAQRSLADDGQILLFTPTAGRDHVDSARITRTAVEAGLDYTSTISADQWTGYRLGRPRR
jgi:hypothetical protein